MKIVTNFIKQKEISLLSLTITKLKRNKLIVVHTCHTGKWGPFVSLTTVWVVPPGVEPHNVSDYM